MALQCIELSDPASGASARVLAGFGFNCFAFSVPHEGRAIDVLWAEEDFASGGRRPSGSGIPILFPFPGRLAGTVLRWEGGEYALEAGDGRGNAIHGFVLNRPWRVLEASESRVAGQFHASLDDPALLAQWPADFRITVRYELTGRALSSQLRVENPDTKPLPCGLGVHPYFRLPLGGPAAGECLVELPVSSRWELADMLPTGRCLPLEDAEQFRQGRPFADLQLDDVFAGLQFRGQQCTAALRDPHSGLSLTLEFDQAFRECVVYTPPHREAICIEPYTCVPGALNLAGRQIEAGLRVLPPGGSFEAHVTMRVD